LTESGICEKGNKDELKKDVLPFIAQQQEKHGQTTKSIKDPRTQKINRRNGPKTELSVL